MKFLAWLRRDRVAELLTDDGLEARLRRALHEDAERLTLDAARCDADWGSATASQRCVRNGGHYGVHVDAEGREFGYVPDTANSWGTAGPTRAVSAYRPGLTGLDARQVVRDYCEPIPCDFEDNYVCARHCNG